MNSTLKRINQYRLARRWSFTTMAQEIGVDSSECRRHLRGLHKPHSETYHVYQVYYDAHKDEINGVLVPAGTP